MKLLLVGSSLNDIGIDVYTFTFSLRITVLYLQHTFIHVNDYCVSTSNDSNKASSQPRIPTLSVSARTFGNTAIQCSSNWTPFRDNITTH